MNETIICINVCLIHQFNFKFFLSSRVLPSVLASGQGSLPVQCRLLRLPLCQDQRPALLTGETPSWTIQTPTLYFDALKELSFHLAKCFSFLLFLFYLLILKVV